VRLRVLGSAASGGVPQWNCGCAQCVSAREATTHAQGSCPPRTQASLAISAGDGRWSLVNASPDVRDQLARFPGLHPKPGTRSLPLDTIVLTSAAPSAVLGLLVLHESLPYRVLTTPWIHDALQGHNALFRALAPAFGTVKIDETFALDRGEQLEAKLFPVAGKLPAWAQQLRGNVAESNVALRVVDKHSGARFVYAPSLARLDTATLAELAEADVRFVDGAFFASDELRALRPGMPDVSALGHAPIAGPDGTLALLRGMRGRTLYTALNNSNAACDAASPEAAHVFAAGCEIARDGDELALSEPLTETAVRSTSSPRA
jgi:pyrroloquinoline quinone biosynthesis protein B